MGVDVLKFYGISLTTFVLGMIIGATVFTPTYTSRHHTVRATGIADGEAFDINGTG